MDHSKAAVKGSVPSWSLGPVLDPVISEVGYLAFHPARRPLGNQFRNIGREWSGRPVSRDREFCRSRSFRLGGYGGRRRTVRFFFFYRWRWRSIPIGYAFARATLFVFSTLRVPTLTGIFAITLTFLENVTAFFAETGVVNPVPVERPELKNRVLDLAPAPR